MALYKVRYKGLSDVREISGGDLKKRGIGISKDLVWDASNGWSLNVEGLSKDLEDLLRTEGTFTISEVKEGGTEDVKVTAVKSDDTGATVTDATTGQTMANKR